MENKIDIFKSGVHNILNAEKIPADASKDSFNFITKDGLVQLIGGRKVIGNEGGIGSITGHHFGYKTDGSKVHYAKFGTKIKYYDGSTWQDCITGLTEDEEYSFANYSSLAGAFTFINGKDGYWKVVNANPANPINIYNSAVNFKGRIFIDKGRTILWNREDDKTGIYGSKIDTQDSDVYTKVTGESIGASGSTNYSGILAQHTSVNNVFAITISGDVSAGTETFTDDYLGNLTSNFGGTGTINYATGAYNVTFSDTTTGAVTADYQYETSNAGSLADFTHSEPRQAGEGFQFPQDEGGDAILNVVVGPDEAYYSMKKHSVYRLALTADDTNASNEIYRKEIGIPNWKAVLSSGEGIIFINTANESKPVMTALSRSVLDNIEPRVLFPQFKFENYNYDKAYMVAYDRWILVACKQTSSDNNDTILLCDVGLGSVDIIRYRGDTLAKNGDDLFMGSSITQSVYQIFNGYDDMDLSIQNYWKGKDETYGADRLKKFRKLRIRGQISPDQYVEISMSYDNTDFNLIGTIRGSGGYVDTSSPQTIGQNMIGEAQIGGADTTTVYPLTFEDRMPKNYRSKQNLSLDGKLTNQ